MITAPIAADQIRRATLRLVHSARPDAPVVPTPRTTRKR
jgi:hypothetical protein